MAAATSLKVRGGVATRAEQEAESEWKVSGVGQMLVEWTVDRMLSSPFMVLLRINSSPNDLRSIGDSEDSGYDL